MITDKFRKEKRKGSLMRCPFCNAQIKYTKLVCWHQEGPFFYSDRSNDVLVRESDGKRIHSLMEKGQPSIDHLLIAWEACLRTAPPAPNGGQFALWANVKCPHCGKEMPYNQGVKNLNLRLHDPYIILIDGAIVVGDSRQDSWQVEVEVCS